ncbi:MAG TPA: exodeoxyribonuclease III [Kiritimatiellia bacterium]|nr:exodeoxyribonuclease III [Kiritimatiellia bacterium]
MLSATYNCNSIRTRLDLVLDWLRAQQPDLLALQETKVVDELFPAAPFRELSYHVTFRGMKAYNGVALLSRRPPDDVRFGFDDAGPADAPRLLHARFGALHVVNTYVPQGRAIDHPMFAYKVDWFARLRRWFDARFTPADLVLWLGDLNVAAEPIDVNNPEERADHVCYHAAARRVFADCRAWGFEDVFRRFNPGPGHYSFFDYRKPFTPDRKEGWRLDYQLATRPLAARARASIIDLAPRAAPRPSDHTPVLAEFAVNFARE